MTPEERALAAWRHYTGRSIEPALLESLAAALREAVAAEREENAALLEKKFPGEFREMTAADSVHEWVGQTQFRTARLAAAAIRARSALAPGG